ncbi:MAG TPA: hypothetical protein PKM48_14420 [Parvularculaceae bacterium]|nr:hypothetical protein [Parvularculaceae bacterium]
MTTSAAAPKWFYALAVVALLWNLMGVAAYVGQMTMSDEAMAALSEAERALYETQPAWAVGAFALAVFGGALGSLLLLLRRRLAEPVLISSLVGIVVQFVYNFFIVKTMAVYGPGAVIMPVMVIAIGVALVLLARHARAAGWLR